MTSPVPLQKVPLSSRTRRSASDAGQHSPSTAKQKNNCDLSAEQLRQALSDFRTKLDASTEGLSSPSRRALERELTLTIQAIDMEPPEMRDQSSSGANESVAPDGWLARMIDERLDLRLGKDSREKAGNKEMS